MHSVTSEETKGRKDKEKVWVWLGVVLCGGFLGGGGVFLGGGGGVVFVGGGGGRQHTSGERGVRENTRAAKGKD